MANLDPDARHRLVTDALKRAGINNEPTEEERLMEKYKAVLSKIHYLARPIREAEITAGRGQNNKALALFVGKALYDEFGKFEKEELMFLMTNMHVFKVLNDLATENF